MSSYKPVAETNLGLPAGTYVYDISISAPTSHLAATTSASTLELLNPSTLRPVHTFHTAQNITDLAWLGENIYATSGREKNIKVWDERVNTQVGEFLSDRAVLSLGACPREGILASGTEFESAVAKISIWDLRMQQVKLELKESHNDDITVLKFHPTDSHVLLSGSTDGLVNLYNLRADGIDPADADEEALVQILNHGSAIHKAGFFGNWVWAVSSDEKLGMYEVDGEGGEWIPGDIRETLEAGYVVDVVEDEDNSGFVVAGNLDKEVVECTRIRKKSGDWGFSKRKRTTRLVGGHGEEVCRTVLWGKIPERIVTGGEDGLIKIWKADEVSNPTKLSKKDKEKARFKPY